MSVDLFSLVDKAVRKSQTHCPIALAIKQIMSELPDIGADIVSIKVIGNAVHIECKNGKTEIMHLADDVVETIKNYDNGGEWPEKHRWFHCYPTILGPITKPSNVKYVRE